MFFQIFVDLTLNFCLDAMEQHALRNVDNCLNTSIYFYLETSGGQSFKQYLMLFIFPTPELI